MVQVCGGGAQAAGRHVPLVGSKFAWHRGSRGLQLVWIGVLFVVKIEELIIEVTLPQKTVATLREEAIAIKGQAVLAVSRLKTFTGQKI